MDKPQPKLPSVLDVVRCPRTACVCGKGGGALLCKIYRGHGSRVVVETVCPNAKKAVIRVPLGEQHERALTELERITEGLHLLQAHGGGDIHTYQDGLLVWISRSSHSAALDAAMSELGWRPHAVDGCRGFLFLLSPL